VRRISAFSHSDRGTNNTASHVVRGGRFIATVANSSWAVRLGCLISWTALTFVLVATAPSTARASESWRFEGARGIRDPHRCGERHWRVLRLAGRGAEAAARDSAGERGLSAAAASGAVAERGV